VNGIPADQAAAEFEERAMNAGTIPRDHRLDTTIEQRSSMSLEVLAAVGIGQTRFRAASGRAIRELAESRRSAAATV